MTRHHGEKLLPHRYNGRVPILPAVGTFVIALVVAYASTRIAIVAGLRLGISDVPGGRRRHTRITSRLGIVPLFVGFTVAALAAQAFGVPTLDPNETRRLAGLLLGGLILLVVGLLDDRFQLPPGPQFAAQAVAAGVAMAALVFIERFTNPLTGETVIAPALVAVVISLFWFMGMMNTVNWLDGVDGLAATVALMAAIVTAIHMAREGQYSVALLPIALAGTLCGFLLLNLPPARIFLGSGATYLGFTLACVGVIAGAKIALLMLVLGLPIADVAWQIFDRARNGRNPTRGDRGHLHFRLADAGWSAGRIVALYAAACAAFGFLALVPQSPTLKLITLAVLFAAVVALLVALSARSRRGQPATADPAAAPSAGANDES